jgi:hypothetical protein
MPAYPWRSPPVSLMSALSRAYLIGPMGQSTAHQGRTLRRLATTPPLLGYLTNRYKRTPFTADFINWAAHQGVLKKKGKHRIQLTKLVFDILPTTNQVNKFDKGHCTCPSCPQPHEDCDHILLRSPSPSRHEWRGNFLSSIFAICNSSDTVCHLSNLLCTSFKLWFLSDQDISINYLCYPPSLQRLITQQNSIEGCQFFNPKQSILKSPSRPGP